MENHAWYMKNETLKTIQERHSIRLFSEEPVADEDLRVLLEAANSAPSAHNQQSWHFIVIRGEKKRELVELVNHRAMEFPKSTSVFLRMASRSIASAPVVVAVANTGSLIEHGTKLFQVKPEMAHDFFRTMEIQGSAAAAQNLLLAATSLGLAAVWLGALFLLKDEVLQLLGEPQGEFMAVIPVGHSTKQTKGPVKQPLETIVKYLD
ncbi:MAG TPA: nitroreductase family protein [Bacillota bacterium]|nr:nitroreductase family protein [Bacillota bacterium]